VKTKHGEREGIVIARTFDHIVVTIITPEDRLFQFAAEDIQSISATEKVLIGVSTFLRKSASEKAEPETRLTRGQEITILEKKENSNWIKVKAWGDKEGWIIEDVLTNRVVYTPEEKMSSAKKMRFSQPSIPSGTEESKQESEKP